MELVQPMQCNYHSMKMQNYHFTTVLRKLLKYIYLCRILVLPIPKGGSILVHVGMNNTDRDGTTRTEKRYRELVETLMKTRVKQIILSGILPVMRGRGATFRNCKRMAINALLEQMCEEEGVGFVDLWGYFVGKKTCI